MPSNVSFFRRMFSFGPVVPVVRLEGVIQSGGRGFGGPRSLNIANTARSLDRAFSMSRAQAVALIINSPGGSAAQSHLIARRVLALSKEKKKPVYAFVEDTAASGGYILALGADEIYCDPFSLVGSIGVIFAGFGFTEAMKKLGIERRVHTAGKHKDFLDPFLEESEYDKKRTEALLSNMHAEFKGFVKERRGSKITQSDEVLFEGDFWLAKQALDYGLIDGIGDVRTIMRKKFGDDVLLPIISSTPRLFMPSDLGGANIIGSVIEQMKTQETWRKLGI